MNRDKFRDKQLKYWRKRNNELHKAVDLEADAVIKTLKQAYKDAENSINQNIAQWYQKLADNNEITLADAKKWLAADELADFKMTLDEYIRHGEELNIDPSWKKAMINASSKHHISSYEAQKMLAQAEVEEAVAKIDGSWIDRAAKTAYLHRLYDAQIAKGTMFRAPNTDRAVRAAKRPWTPDGMEFVERAHVNNAKLVQKIHRDLTQAAITGESYETTARRISKDFALTVYESVRIVRTESCHIETEASMQAYRDCGIDQYQVLATLDRKTCEICADMDMQVVNLSDRMDGYNAPPFHPNCRCTTIAYFADMEDDDTTRVGRNEEGRNVPMDGSMTYDEWAEKYGNVERMASSSYILWPQVGTPLTRSEFKELRSYAEQRGLKIKGIRRSDMNVEAVKSAIDGVHLMAQKYNIKNAFGEPITLDFSKSLNPNNFAAITRAEPNVIYFNRDAYRNIEALKKEYSKKAETGYFVKGTDYTAIPYHEMGHMVEAIYGIDSVSIAKDILGAETEAETMERITTSLSQYAGKLTCSEIMSESFAAVYGGAENEFALKFVEKCNIIISRR